MSLHFLIPLSIILGILAVVSFLFSASETSIIGLSKIRLHHMVSKGVKGAARVQNLVAKSDKFIATILVGNNFVNIAMSAITTGIFVQIFGYNLGITLATFAVTLFVLIFCEITPKILATKHPEKVALLTAPLMEKLVWFFRFITPVFIKISNSILRIFRIQPPKRSPLITEEELRLMIEVGKDQGVLTDEERKMLHRIFEFGDTKISEVMVPKDKIVALDINSGIDDMLDFFLEAGHARVPVYSGTVDNIVGVIFTRDLLYILRHRGLFILQDLVRRPYYTSADLSVNELLRKFQMDKVQIAVVVDQKRNTLGLVTLEDLLEEIVGEIEEDVSVKVR